MIYCGEVEFGQIYRSFSLNSGAIRLKRPKNLTQIGFPSLRSVKSDFPLEPEDVFCPRPNTYPGPGWFSSIWTWSSFNP
jgi:hypothetical protein